MRWTVYRGCLTHRQRHTLRPHTSTGHRCVHLDDEPSIRFRFLLRRTRPNLPGIMGSLPLSGRTLRARCLGQTIFPNVTADMRWPITLLSQEPYREVGLRRSRRVENGVATSNPEVKMGLAVNFRSSKPITGKSKFITENGQDLVRTSHVMYGTLQRRQGHPALAVSLCSGTSRVRGWSGVNVRELRLRMYGYFSRVCHLCRPPGERLPSPKTLARRSLLTGSWAVREAGWPAS